jgi:MFS family permease
MPEPSVAHRWIMLVSSLLAAMATAVVVNGIAFLIPALHRDGMALTTASTLAVLPTVGLMIAIIPWGILIDRYGERAILLTSLGLTTALAGSTYAASLSHAGYGVIGACALLTGLASAATNGASGRLVVGWFPPTQRGTAMGARQMAQPLGVAACALTMPVLAEKYGIAAGFAVPMVVSAIALIAVAVTVVDPPRHPAPKSASGKRDQNPYRRGSFLPRVHGVSVLLVVPQGLLWTFVPAWLMVAHHWSAASTGVLVTATQLLGAAARLASGRWSDVWGSRMKPIRVIAAAAAIACALLALLDWVDTPFAVVVMVIASIITVTDNGLAFTAVAEYAGAHWSGRALAIQNTSQYLAMSATTPMFGALIAATGFPAAFIVAAALPLIAMPLVPRDHVDREPEPVATD